MKTNPTETDVMDLLRNGTAQERASFVDRLPSNRWQQAARQLVSSDKPGTVVVALGGVIQYFCDGADPELGAVLAAAAHERGRELWEGSPDHHGLQQQTLTAFADGHCKALLRLGRSTQLLETADRYLDLYAAIGDSDNTRQIRIRRVEALLILKRIDEAELALRAMPRGDSATLVEADRLQRTVDEWKVGIDKVRQREPSPGPTVAAQQVPDLVALMGESILRCGHTSETTDIAIRQRIQAATSIFTGAPAKPKILESLERLQSALESAQAKGLAMLVNEALWGIYLCQSRLHAYSKAADALTLLRQNLETIRRGIQDFRKRGGVYANYPHLFGALCEYLYKAGRPADLLEAIEASKGRAIADRLTEQAGVVVDDAGTYAAASALPKLAQRESFHYLTCFVDDAVIHGVLVSKRGDIRMLDPIPIARGDLERLAGGVDPLRWGKPRHDNVEGRIESLQVALAPLAKWLGDLISEGGVLDEGDHLCYSADDALHHVPLHYLSLGKALLIDRLSLSRVHSAFHLDHLLSKPVAPIPNRYFGVAVGLASEQGKPGFQDSLQAPSRWLHDRLQQGELLAGAAATLVRFLDAELDGRIVHLSTHGMFSTEVVSPFDESYLLLADDQGLPAERRGGKLTPRAIFDAALDFSGSDVCVMACVSGLARNGVAGDALGLDWAFIQAGATSLMSTHWEVPASAAARFFVEYYEHWIVHGGSRAQAHRAAMRSLLADDRSPAALNKWAAFSLTGDFR